MSSRFISKVALRAPHTFSVYCVVDKQGVCYIECMFLIKTVSLNKHTCI